MSGLADLRERLRRSGECRGDAMLAGAFALTGALESVVTSTQVGQNRTLSVAVAVVICAPLAWRRRNPLLAAVGFGALSLAQVPLDTLYPETTPFVAMFVVLYTLGRYGSGREAVIGELVLLATIFTLGVTSVGERRNVVIQIVWVAVLFTTPVLVGRAMRVRVRLQQELREHTDRLHAEKELRAARAVHEERARIAEELQAIVANAVSAMVLQAEAVPRVLATGEPARAVEALAAVSQTGRDTLEQMRALLGVLRHEGERGARRPQPSLARVDSLVERMRAGGPAISLQISGERRDLPVGVDLAAYRVVNEALARAVDAAGVSNIVVDVRYGERHVTVAVSDDRRASGGFDPQVMLALRERVRLYGGTLRTGRAGGFHVTARLPMDAAA